MKLCGAQYRMIHVELYTQCRKVHVPPQYRKVHVYINIGTLSPRN